MRLFVATTVLIFGNLAPFLEAQIAGADPIAVARQAFEQGDLERARAALATSAKPSAVLLDLRGCVELEQTKFDEAAASFQAAHAMEPALFAPRLHCGDVSLRQRRWKEARTVYEALLKETNILTSHERLRYAVLITYLGEADEAAAQTALGRVTFPTETPAYYYAQAAVAFAHGQRRDAEKWIATASEIFDRKRTAWFARPLFELGWLKTKPPLTAD